jgi:hypothetical protein
VLITNEIHENAPENLLRPVPPSGNFAEGLNHYGILLGRKYQHLDTLIQGNCAVVDAGGSRRVSPESNTMAVDRVGGICISGGAL